MHSLFLVFLVFAAHELTHLLFHPFLKRVATMETTFLSPEWCPFVFFYFGVSLLKLNIGEKRYPCYRGVAEEPRKPKNIVQRFSCSFPIADFARGALTRPEPPP